MSSLPLLGKQTRKGGGRDVTAASWAHDAEMGLPLLEDVEGDSGRQRVESMDLGLGLGRRRTGAEDEHPDDDDDDDNDDEADKDAITATTGNGGGADSESGAVQPSQYFFSQEMRFRLSPRALALAESVAIQDDKPQGRSTSICKAAQAAGRYDEVTVERELQEGTRAGAAAPTPKPSQGISLEMPDETSRRLLEDPLLSSRYPREGTKKSGRRRATSTARLPQLQAQADNTISRGLNISHDFTTSGQSVNKSDHRAVRKTIDGASSDLKSRKPSQRLPPITRADAAGKDTPPSPSNGKPFPDCTHTQSNVTESNVRNLNLCVDLGTCHFTAIDCRDLSDDKFFEKPKASYDSTRGPWRRCFSLQQYHHCDFYLFGKWGVNLGGPVEKLSFPLQADSSSHDFQPGAPISPQEFYDRYYYPEGKYWASSSAAPSIDRATASLPLRTGKLDWSNGQRETFYGLLAVEQRCYWRLHLYLGLLVAVGAVLGSLWAAEWGGHGLENVQNALTPLQLALAVWQIVVV